MRWTTSVVRVDIDTGEQLTKHQATGKNTQYIKIKSTKHATINYREGRGHAAITIQYKRNPQQRLEFS